MQQTSYISSMAPRTMLDMCVQKEIEVLAAVNNVMQSEEIYLMPYLNYWPTFRESVGELKHRHSYNNTCCNLSANLINL